MKHMLTKQGFTLIELIMVVLIIGVLAAVALPQYTRSLKRTKASEGLAQGKIIYDSAVRYRDAKGGTSPNEFERLDIDLEYEGDLKTPQITIGDFTYTLGQNEVSAANSKESYTLKFNYPVENSSGVQADILCCTSSNKICKTMGTTVKSGCIKVK